MQQERSLFVLWGPSRVSIRRHLPRILSLDFCKQKKWVFRCTVSSDLICWFFFLYNEPRLNNVSFFLEMLQIWGRNQSWQWSGVFGWWSNCIHFKSLSAQTSASYHFERFDLVQLFGKKNPRHSQLPFNSLKVVGYFYFKMIIFVF